MAAKLNPWHALKAGIRRLRKRRSPDRTEFVCSYIAILRARADGVDLTWHMNDRADANPRACDFQKADYLELPKWVIKKEER